MLESLEWTYFAVFILAAVPWFELAAVVPLSILYGLAPIPVAMLGFAGNWMTVVLVILLFDQMRRWRLKLRNRQEALAAAADTFTEQKGSMKISSEAVADVSDVEEEGTGLASRRGKLARKIWKRFGLPGLALIGPIFVGSHITASVAIAFQAPRRLVTMWMSVSLAGRTIVWTVAAYYGFDALGFIKADLIEEALNAPS